MQSKRILFEKFESEDFNDFLALLSDENVTRFTSGVHTEASARTKFDNLLEKNKQHDALGFYKITAIADGAYIGLAKLEIIKDKEAEVGYVLMESFWGKGMGSEISKFLVEYGQTFDIINTIIGIVHPDNIASKRILIKSGLHFNKLGIYREEPAEFYHIQF